MPLTFPSNTVASIGGSSLTSRQVYSVDFTVAFGAITALTGTVVTQAITGLLTTDAVHLHSLASLTGVNIATAWCSSNGTLSIGMTTAVAIGVTLGSVSYRLTIFR